MAASVPFISWAAGLEARARGPEERATLGALCERLVVERERLDADRMDEAYAKTLALVAGGDAQQEALVLADPAAYSTRLAEALTGAPVVRSGYSPAYDALLAAAPTAALTPEGVAKAHKEAAELAVDMRARRRRSFAAVVGRMRITSPEQEAALLAPSPASRILDLLLSLPTEAERRALLLDCFTPPPTGAEGSSSGEASSSGGGGGGSGSVEGEETDELWCTPTQLLTEVDARLRAVGAAAGDAASSSGGGAGGSGERPQPLLAGGGHGLSGAAFVEALEGLRAAVAERWLDSLPSGEAAAGRGGPLL